ncbi:MAG: class I SAM-dependent methyltransferase [Desulfobacteraceae bacterium]|nr:class I SAM-dependent methyltransferase [Desulfobacteraceae bacterium]
MSFSLFFSKQAKKPFGLFGRIIMASIFDIGNAFLNEMVNDALAIENKDYVLDIGCGTGKLIRNMANQISEGYIEGVDFSHSMVSIARRKSKKQINRGTIKIVEGDFDSLSYQNESFDKVCSVNTIYFWPKPEVTAKKISSILKSGGLLFLAFEDIQQLQQRNLNHDVFSFYTTEKVKDLLSRSGFNPIEIISKTNGKLKFHCVVAKK